MLRSDLIKKFIDKFVIYDETVIKLLSENKVSDAYDVVNEGYKELFRLNSKSFNTLSDDNLVELLKVNGIVETFRFIIAGRLMQLEGNLLSLQGYYTAATHILKKSLRIYLEGYLRDSDEDMANYYPNIIEIYNALSDDSITNNTLLKMAQYYELTRDFAEAENLYYELLVKSGYESSYIETVVDFYKRLLLLDDNSLICGNLPRNEVDEGLKLLLQKVYNDTKIN